MEIDLTELGIDLGEPTIKELNIPDEIDEKIETGHVFILFSGKPAKKIGPKTLEIYENAEIPGLQMADPMGDFEKRMQEFASAFEQERLPQFLGEHEPFELPRYVKDKEWHSSGKTVGGTAVFLTGRLYGDESYSYCGELYSNRRKNCRCIYKKPFGSN